MNRYESYKEVNLPWLKEVPSHWEVKKVNFIFDERREKVSDKDYQALSVTKKGIFKQLDNVAKTNNGDNRKKVLINDFVINSRSDRKGSSGLSSYEGSVSLINTVLSIKNGIPNFLNYLLKSIPFQEEFYRNGKGIVADLWSTNFESMKNITLPFPSLKEQTQIANYLDWKISEIDRLIAKEKEKIRELNDLKKITVSDIFMSKKENTNKIVSKYEWIGEIPEYYKVYPLKKLCNKIIDGTHQTPQYTSEGVPFLRVTDISKLELSESIDWDNVAFISKEEHKELYKRCNPEKNDVLVSKNGTIGIPKIVDWNEEVSIFVSLCLLKLNHLVFPEWIYYYFLTYLTERKISYGGKTGTITNLHLNKIREFKIPVPNLDKQKEIVKKINMEINKINNLIDKTNQQIQNLESLKQSLISEVVTGQMDVRDVVIPEYEKFTLENDLELEEELEEDA